MARSAAQAKDAGPVLLSIGQVLAKLTPEHPELTPSKLRFLEEQGLVSPARTPSGYRKFSAGDLERLKLVLSMQRDHYLPLKVIRDYLADLDAGLRPLLPGGSARPSRPNMLSTGRRFTRDELLREAGATPQLLAEAVSASFIQASDLFGEDALQMLAALVALAGRGIEPRHLRTVRAAVERELGLIESAVAPLAHRRDASGRAKTADTAQEIARQLDTVRRTLLQSGLDRLAP
ncbi:MerR family transcriptional regulator [Gryllotalpicola protaetiae]|uniref:MerR family transcriptional regulator n=1 Tax=Gryllotalpicola protaetiae TaxID=2419771 RepID=A0A387BV39_9MICO|nr:MerR family transcriptional regulator [Gryllotalpicola protaetiae]AYG04737.1 MerR family transcriptional regulator [Gryllotalpicola protaetiae]